MLGGAVPSEVCGTGGCRRVGWSGSPQLLLLPAVSSQLDPFAAIDYSLLGRPLIAAEHGDVAIKVTSAQVAWAGNGAQRELD